MTPLLIIPQAKEGSDQDGRKSFSKQGSKGSDATDFPGNDVQQLDPISEEDEKLDHSTSSRVKGDSYQKLPSDEDSGPEEDNTTPLLHKEKGAEHRAALTTGLLNKPSFLSEILLDKKDSSDSGMRSSDSSSDPSLEDSDAPKPNLMELELEGLVKKRGLLPSSLSGLQESTVARMSICSEAASEASLMASSPDVDWPSGAVTNLNRSASNSTLNNNTSDLATATNSNANNSSESAALIIVPGNGTTTATVHNHNLRTISLGDERESVL